MGLCSSAQSGPWVPCLRNKELGEKVAEFLLLLSTLWLCGPARGTSSRLYLSQQGRSQRVDVDVLPEPLRPEQSSTEHEGRGRLLNGGAEENFD